MKHKKSRLVLPNWKTLCQVIGVLSVIFAVSAADIALQKIKVLPADLPLLLLIHFVIHLSLWGIFVFIVMLIYRASLLRSDKNAVNLKRKWARLIIGNLLFFAALFVMKYQAVPALQQKERILEKKQEYATLFYEGSMDAFLSARSRFDSFVGDDLDRLPPVELEALSEQVDRLDNDFKQYLYYDYSLQLDKRRRRMALQLQSELESWKGKVENALRREPNRSPMSFREKYRAVDRADALLRQSLSQGEVVPAMESYAVCQAGLRKNPTDLEFLDGLEQAKRQIDRLVFYRSEISRLFEHPLWSDFSMKTRDYCDADGNPLSEWMHCDRIIRFQNQLYFQNAEIIGKNRETGETVYRIQSEYAKRLRNSLIFRSLKQKVRMNELRVASVSNPRYRNYENLLPFSVSETEIDYFSNRGRFDYRRRNATLLAPVFRAEACLGGGVEAGTGKEGKSPGEEAKTLPGAESESESAQFSEGHSLPLICGFVSTALLMRRFRPADGEFGALFSHLLALWIELLLTLTLPAWIVLMSAEVKAQNGFSKPARQYYGFPVAVVGVTVIAVFLETVIKSTVFHSVRLMGISAATAMMVSASVLFFGSIGIVYWVRKKKDRI